MSATAPIILDDDTDSPFTIPACADTDQAALLAWAHDNPIDKPRPVVEDGRYVLTDPATGEPRKWTRVTTFCDDAENSNFAAWRDGMLVRGFVVDPTLIPWAHREPDEWKAYAAIAAEATRQGGGWLAADLGTALHTATEHHDLGTGIRPPAPWDTHVDAWASALAEHGITIVDGWAERCVINTDVDCAGTLDRLAILPDGRTVVLDLKTGSSVRKIGYAVQAAIYARASHAWTPDGYEPLPEVDRSMALIAHLPSKGQGCEIIEVDITRGWDVALTCHALRSSRSVKGIFTQRKPAPQLALAAPATTIEVRSATVRDAIAAVKVAHPGKLGTVWPTGVAPRGPWASADLDAIEAALAALNTPPATEPAKAKRATKKATTPRTTKTEWPTVDAQPVTRPEWTATDDSPLVDDATRDALAAAIETMPPAHRALAASWQAGGRNQRRSWGSVHPGKMTSRTHALNLAAMRCATALHDDDDPDALTRAALSLVIGEDVQPTWLTGAVIGSLTIDQANRLEEIAASFAAGDDTTTRQLGEAVTRVA